MDLHDEILRLETALADRDAAAVNGTLEDLIADDFVEFGASGRTWDAESVRVLLRESTPSEPVEIADFEIVRLADEVVLALYRIEGTRPSSRSSIWVRRAGRWVIRFHQGTLRPR